MDQQLNIPLAQFATSAAAIFKAVNRAPEHLAPKKKQTEAKAKAEKKAIERELAIQAELDKHIPVTVLTDLIVEYL